MNEVPSPCKDINELLPHVQGRVLKWLQACKDNGIDILIYETYRTPERQKALYAIGRTVDKDKPVVTSTLNSMHIRRRAIDFVPTIKRVPQWNDIALYNKAIDLAIALGFESGRSYKIKDYPHLQYMLAPLPTEESIPPRYKGL